MEIAYRIRNDERNRCREGTHAAENARALKASWPLLPNGQVLVAGGIVNISPSGGSISVTFTATAELYNPATGKWTTTSSMTTPRSGQGATLLENGQVLMAQVNAELYDPTAGRWTLTAHMPWPRPGWQRRAAFKWRRGVLRIPSPELCQPALGPIHQHPDSDLRPKLRRNFRRTPDTARQRKGSALAGGKPKYGSVTGACMLYDPSTNHWVLTGNLNPRASHTLTRLQNGQVLAAGGSAPLGRSCQRRTLHAVAHSRARHLHSRLAWPRKSRFCGANRSRARCGVSA